MVKKNKIDNGEYKSIRKYRKKIVEVLIKLKSQNLLTFKSIYLNTNLLIL